MSPDEFFELAEAGAPVYPAPSVDYIRIGDRHEIFNFHMLDEEGQHRFLKLWKDKKLNFDEPPFLLVLPYFLRIGSFL